MVSLQGTIVGLTALNAVLAILWRPINDPIYTIFDGVTAAGELILVVAIQLELSGHISVPSEFLVTVSLGIVMCNAGKQVQHLDFRAPSRAIVWLASNDWANLDSLFCVLSCRFRMCCTPGC